MDNSRDDLSPSNLDLQTTFDTNNAGSARSPDSPAFVKNLQSHVRSISTNSSPKSSPSLQRKSSDADIKLGSVSHALMATSALSSTLAIPKHTPSSDDQNLDTSLTSVNGCDEENGLDEDRLGKLPQNTHGQEQREVNNSQDNISRSSESGKSLDGSSVSVSRSYDSRLDNEKSCERSSSGETKGTVSSMGKSEKKKKSTAWYNMLNPTYKSRSEDFKKIFKDLPESERLIVDYSCAMQKDLIVHGRLYLSQNYICFYANIFRWETAVVLKCKDVASMTKEKTARVIPNAIQICTDSDKHFFTSFGARDKTYMMLFRVWQNALLDQPMTIQELWQWVHYSYGEELGLTSDDDDYVAPLDDKADGDHCGIITVDDKIRQRAKAGEEDETDSYKPAMGSSVYIDASSTPHLLVDGSQKEVHSKEKVLLKSKSDDAMKIGDVPTDMSDTSDTNEPEAEIPCPCQSHEGKEVVNEVFQFSADQMFALLFGGSKFLLNLYDNRKIYDVNQSPWTKGEQPHKIRQLTYTVSLNNPMSPKTAQTTETQTLLDEKPEQVYIVRSDVVSTGIPYGDSFSCYANYCITKVNSKKCRIKICIGVIYRKSVFGLVKGFIEKNAISNMADYYNDLCIALHREAGCQGDVPTKPKKSRRRRRIKTGEIKTEYGSEAARNTHVHNSNRIPGPIGSQANSSPLMVPDIFIKLVLAALLLLVFMIFMLFYKIWTLEEQAGLLTSTYQGFINLNSFEGNLPDNNEDWMKLLHKQEMLNKIEREKWKSRVSDVIKLIQTTEASLTQLYKSIQDSHFQVPLSKSYSSSSTLVNTPKMAEQTTPRC